MSIINFIVTMLLFYFKFKSINHDNNYYVGIQTKATIILIYIGMNKHRYYKLRLILKLTIINWYTKNSVKIIVQS